MNVMHCVKINVLCFLEYMFVFSLLMYENIYIDIIYIFVYTCICFCFTSCRNLPINRSMLKLAVNHCVACSTLWQC